MIPVLTLSVTILSLLATLFLLWTLAAPKEDEVETRAIGFHPKPQEAPEDE